MALTRSLQGKRHATRDAAQSWERRRRVLSFENHPRAPFRGDGNRAPSCQRRAEARLLPVGSTVTTHPRTPFFGALPTDGIWTSLGLGRAQFFAILALSLALFVFIDGPVWHHVHAAHFRRITFSYGAIVPAVWTALVSNRTPRIPLLLGASAVIALVKLVVTAAVLVLLALAETR